MTDVVEGDDLTVWDDARISYRDGMMLLGDEGMVFTFDSDGTPCR